MTISEALSWIKTMQGRHNELIRLRDANAKSVTQSYQGQTIQQTPTYDAKALDRKIVMLAREIRLLSEAVKKCNSTVEVPNYVRNDDVLGELDN